MQWFSLLFLSSFLRVYLLCLLFTTQIRLFVVSRNKIVYDFLAEVKNKQTLSCKRYANKKRRFWDFREGENERKGNMEKPMRTNDIDPKVTLHNQTKGRKMVKKKMHFYQLKNSHKIAFFVVEHSSSIRFLFHVPFSHCLYLFVFRVCRVFLQKS